MSKMLKAKALHVKLLNRFWNLKMLTTHISSNLKSILEQQSCKTIKSP